MAKDKDGINPKIVGPALREKRRARSKSAEQFAREKGWPSTYPKQERGQRPISLGDLTIYAAEFGETVEFFKSGGRNNLTEEEAIAQQYDNVETSEFPLIQPEEINALRTLSKGGILVRAEKKPVPEEVNPKRRTIVTRIAEGDDSMIGPAYGKSYPPGTIYYVDPDAPILPGRPVMAILKGHTHAVLRLFRASGPHQLGQPFWLQALNPAYVEQAFPARAADVIIYRVIGILETT